MSTVDKTLETDERLCDRATSVPDPVSGLALVCIYQFDGVLCVETRCVKTPELAGYVTDRQSVG